MLKSNEENPFFYLRYPCTLPFYYTTKSNTIEMKAIETIMAITFLTMVILVGCCYIINGCRNGKSLNIFESDTLFYYSPNPNGYYDKIPKKFVNRYEKICPPDISDEPEVLGYYYGYHNAYRSVMLGDTIIVTDLSTLEDFNKIFYPKEGKNEKYKKGFYKGYKSGYKHGMVDRKKTDVYYKTNLNDGLD